METTQQTLKSHPNDEAFAQLVVKLNTRIHRLLREHEAAYVVRLDEKALENAYLNAFGTDAIRQEHNCSCCRHWLRNYGGLVVIDPETARPISLLWDETEAPEVYAASVRSMRRLVENAPIQGTFNPQWAYSELGESIKGGYEHFVIGGVQNIRQKFARKFNSHDHGVLSRALAEFPLSAWERGEEMLKTDYVLRHYPKVAEGVSLFTKIRARVDGRSQRERDNLIWYYLPITPSVIHHMQNTVGGKYVANLARGASPDDARRLFETMVDPSQYMRPQSAPSVGNVQEAEKLIAELGLESALARRFATLEDLPETAFVWRKSEQKEEKSEGVFGHLLKPEDSASAKTQVNGGNISFKRLVEEILPHAEALTIKLAGMASSYGTLVTQADPTAKPLLIWDKEEARNPISYYNYVKGSTPEAWDLPVGRPLQIRAVIKFPAQYTDAYQAAKEESGLMFVFEEGRETREGGLGLFPEILRRELFPVRATLEEFSKRGKILSPEDSLATLVYPATTQRSSLAVTVHRTHTATTYLIDRFE